MDRLALAGSSYGGDLKMWVIALAALVAAESGGAPVEQTPIKITDDPFKATVSFVTNAKKIENAKGFYSASYILFASRSREETGNFLPAVIVNLVYRDDWRRYEEATLRGGRQIPGVVNIKRNVVSCAGVSYSNICLLSETVAVPVLQSDVLEGGLEFQINGRVPIQISIGKNEVDSFLLQVKAYKSKMQVK